MKFNSQAVTKVIACNSGHTQTSDSYTYFVLIFNKQQHCNYNSSTVTSYTHTLYAWKGAWYNQYAILYLITNTQFTLMSSIAYSLYHAHFEAYVCSWWYWAIVVAMLLYVEKDYKIGIIVRSMVCWELSYP